MKKVYEEKLMGIKAKFEQMKIATVNFLKEEKSARGSIDESWLIYGGLVVGIIALLIWTGAGDMAFNALGNMFNDGVNGQIDQGGLNQWGDQTDGFNRE